MRTPTMAAADRAEHTKLRYRWSHRHPVHRAVVRTANRVLPAVPFRVKYAFTDALRNRQLPYRLLDSTSVAIQIGAPRDTLRSGRSRAMAFVRRTSPGGRVLVIEPDKASAEEFRRTAERHGLKHAVVVCAAAWNERTTLTMEIDPHHPATNFTAGTTDYASTEMARFHEVSVDAVPVDDLVDEIALMRVDLVSITTNGAEEEILQGMHRTLQRDKPDICLARTEDSYAGLMASLGYELLGEDDRGFTFRHRS
jgi:FkbM family methyltransferase